MTIEEIRLLYDLDLTDYPELARFRDMFVLGCLTGLRFSDYNSIREGIPAPEHLTDNPKDYPNWKIVGYRQPRPMK